MADDNTIIEGTVKFRDGKKWKSRWCVMRKLSPVADCVHLQLYREAGRRSGCKASLSLQQYLGLETGFTLDKHSNTLALVCRDLVAVLAFDTRERLIQWQVKVTSTLGAARNYLVLVGSSPGGTRPRLPCGPARLHVLPGRFALTAGTPPRTLNVWEHKHLRRYGVVEGRFCFEGGSHCGKGEGLHVLITDQAKDIADTFDLAAQGKLSPRRRLFTSSKNEGPQSPQSHKAYRPDTRLSELRDQAPPLHDRTPCGDPGWRDGMDLGLGDTVSVHEELNSAAISRCRSCMSKLGAGALSRSSTAALTPGARHFAPNWTMDVSPGYTGVASIPWEEGRSISRATSTDLCACPDRPPERPPKPTTLELNLNKKPPMPLPSCGCFKEESTKVGPYENYDVPKLPSTEMDGEYYDTPKRLKDCLNEDLFQITKSSTPNALILKKPCGCLLKFGRRRNEPTVVDCEENFQPPNCPCQRVTDWANNWIRLPYCKRNGKESDGVTPNKENLQPNGIEQSALYATIDLSRKTRRKTPSGDYRDVVTPNYLEPPVVDPQKVEIDDGPLANYENLSFALSLEYYENAKDVLKKAGITQSELDAIGASLNPLSVMKTDVKCVCAKCGHSNNKRDDRKESSTSTTTDDYLMMEPNTLEGNKTEPIGKPLPAGYTPMSPIGGFAFHTLKHPTKNPITKLLEEKSASNPTLCGVLPLQGVQVTTAEVHITRPIDRDPRTEYRKRSSSADSSRFLDDVQEFDGQGSTSSIETLRDRSGCRHKLSDNYKSEASKRAPQVAVKRSSSVPVAAGNRDSSSSNDSGVSSCSLRPGADFELPLTTGRRHHSPRGTTYRRASLPRRSKSTDPLRDTASHGDTSSQAKSSSAEAEVPVLPCKPLRSVVDTHSTTSSGTSDMSDYIETLSICSSHSSTDTPVTMRVVRHTTSTLRPRSGKEYLSFDTRMTGAYRRQRHYSDMPS